MTPDRSNKLNSDSVQQSYTSQGSARQDNAWQNGSRQNNNQGEGISQGDAHHDVMKLNYAQQSTSRGGGSFWSATLKRLLILTAIAGVLFALVALWDYQFEYTSVVTYEDGSAETVNQRIPIPLYALVVIFFFAWLIGIVLVFWRSWSRTQKAMTLEVGKLSKEQLRSAILKRYQKNFWMSFGMYSLVIILLIIAVLLLKDSRLWFADDPWFEVLYVMKLLFPYLIATIWIGGVAFLFFWQWRQSASDIVELVDSIELMQTGEEGSNISVPRNLIELQSVLQTMFDRAWEDRHIAGEAEKRKNDLILYLAHDLKTPLTSTIGYLNLLRDSKDITEKQQEAYTEIALEKALRLESLIDQFFEISRFNFQDMVLNKTCFSLKVLLDQLVEEFYPLLDDSGKDIKIEASQDIFVNADADRLARALNNILRNAVSYGAPHTTIVVQVVQVNELAKISITNRGETIPQERLEQIFEKFFRLDEARSTEAGGAGLGLAIAKEVIERHGGDITVTSEYGETTFVVIIPLKD